MENKMYQENDYINKKECCAMLGISRPVLDRLVKQGQIPCFRLGRQVRFSRRAIDAALLDGAGQ